MRTASDHLPGADPRGDAPAPRWHCLRLPSAALLLCAGLLLLAGAAVAGPTLRMNRPQVNVRAAATAQSALVASLHAGDEVERISVRNGWVNVRLPDGRRGWVNSALVQEVLVVTGQNVRLRAGASASSPVAASAAAGDEVVQVQALGDWVEVGLPSGATGWMPQRSVRPKESREATRSASRRTAPPGAASAQGGAAAPDAGVQVTARPEPGSPGVSDSERTATPAGAVRASPYARGLQLAADGDYAGALACFEQVLATDPNNLNALLNAGKAHRQLGEYSEAAERLQQALALAPGRRDLIQGLAEVYGLSAHADSAAKYEALARGEAWASASEAPPAAPTGRGPRMGEWPRATLWVYGAAAAAILLVALLLLLLRRRRSGTGEEEDEAAAEPPPRRGFGRALRESEAEGPAGAFGQDQALERQIEAKKAQLRASSEAFLGERGKGKALDPRADEEQHLDRILEQVDTLRQTLEMQEDRARVYAEVVQLQSLRLEALSRQLRLLRRQSRG